MLKKGLSAISTTLIFACIHAFAAPAGPADAELNSRIDKLLRSELFMTLGGIKPVSSTGPDAETYKKVSEAAADGRIRNPDILFFLDGDGPAMASREAAERLLKDRTANEMLRRYSLTMPRDAEAWVATFTACNADYFRRPFKCDLLFGIGYGYPPLEVEAYAADSAGQREKIISELSSDPGLRALLAQAGIPVPADEEGWLRLQWQSTPAGKTEGPRSWQNAIYEIEAGHKHSPRQSLRLPAEVRFEMPTYSRFTNKELERDGYYLRSVYILTRNYEELLSAGKTPLEIINNPRWLKKDLPAFPEYFLMK